MNDTQGASNAAKAPARDFPTGWVVRITISALVLGVTFWFLPTEEVWASIQRLSPAVWLFTLLVFLGGHVLSAFKWRLLISARDEIPAARALRAHFAGLVANLCLPGAAGGDVVRAGLVLAKAEDKAGIAVGSLADRVIDTLSVFTLACVGAALAFQGGAGAGATLAKAAAVLTVLALGGGLGLWLLRRLPLSGKPRRIADKLLDAVAALQNRKSALAGCFLLSLAIQSVFVGLNVLLARASGVEVPVAAWFFAWSFSKLLAVLPISVGGLGVREASLAALLVPFGAPAARVVAVGLLWQSILIASGLFGALVLFLLSRWKVPKGETAQLETSAAPGERLSP